MYSCSIQDCLTSWKGKVSEDGVQRFGETLRLYKQIKADITRGTLVRTGEVSDSPEVYEKIDPDTGRGVVSLFAGSAGRYTYVTRTMACHRSSGTMTQSPSLTINRAAHILTQRGSALPYRGRKTCLFRCHKLAASDTDVRH